MSSIGVAVQRLRDALAAVAESDLDCASDAELLDVLRALRPVVCGVAAQQTRLIGAVHRRGAVYADGALSTAGWLRSRLRMSDGAAQLRVARAVREVPELAPRRKDTGNGVGVDVEWPGRDRAAGCAVVLHCTLL